MYKRQEQGLEFYPISAATHQGVDELMQAVSRKLADLPPIRSYEPEPVPLEEQVVKAGNEFSVHEEDGVYTVEADWLGQVLGSVNMDDYESLQLSLIHIFYRCYDCFYNLHNMVLSVAGNFDPDAALRLCDEILQPAAPITVERAHVSEPEAVRTHRVDVSMPVATTDVYKRQGVLSRDSGEQRPCRTGTLPSAG